ncbi:MAG: class I fructose-bisphosphate aldolase [Ilumatobacteraceae bacterium]
MTDLRRTLLGDGGRIVVVAVDHPLYSWPCAGLEDRRAVIRTVVDAGADAIICSYGSLRDERPVFGTCATILKLDLTTVAVGGSYPVSEYSLAWTLDDATRLGADAVLTFVQLGAPFELEALRNAAAVAAAADRAGVPYVCEIMPVESERFPEPSAPLAIVAACRVGAELGAHVIKTTMPSTPDAMRETNAFGVPVVLAGGDPADDREAMFAAVRRACAAGAAGVAFGRNVWGSPDPAETVRRLHEAVHGPPPQDEVLVP